VAHQQAAFEEEYRRDPSPSCMSAATVPLVDEAACGGRRKLRLQLGKVTKRMVSLTRDTQADCAELRRGLSSVAAAVRAVDPAIKAEVQRRQGAERSLEGTLCDFRAQLHRQTESLTEVLHGIKKGELNISQLRSIRAKPRIDALERDVVSTRSEFVTAQEALRPEIEQLHREILDAVATTEALRKVFHEETEALGRDLRNEADQLRDESMQVRVETVQLRDDCVQMRVETAHGHDALATELGAVMEQIQSISDQQCGLEEQMREREVELHSLRASIGEQRCLAKEHLETALKTEARERASAMETFRESVLHDSSAATRARQQLEERLGAFEADMGLQIERIRSDVDTRLFEYGEKAKALEECQRSTLESSFSRSAEEGAAHLNKQATALAGAVATERRERMEQDSERSKRVILLAERATEIERQLAAEGRHRAAAISELGRLETRLIKEIRGMHDRIEQIARVSQEDAPLERQCMLEALERTFLEQLTAQDVVHRALVDAVDSRLARCHSELMREQRERAREKATVGESIVYYSDSAEARLGKQDTCLEALRKSIAAGAAELEDVRASLETFVNEHKDFVSEQKMFCGFIDSEHKLRYDLLRRDVASLSSIMDC